MLGQMLRVSAVALLASCSFSAAKSSSSGPDANGPSIDAAPLTCNAGDHACSGRTLQTCGSDGTWDANLDTSCDYTCANAKCVAASNLAADQVKMCGSNAPPLDPGAAGTVTFDNGGGAELVCSGGCGGRTTIPRFTNTPGVSWFCVSSINVQANASLIYPQMNGIPADALGLIVDGDVMIAGQVVFDGRAAVAATNMISDANAAGLGAPGGFSGAEQDETALAAMAADPAVAKAVRSHTSRTTITTSVVAAAAVAISSPAAAAAPARTAIRATSRTAAMAARSRRRRR